MNWILARCVFGIAADFGERSVDKRTEMKSGSSTEMQPDWRSVWKLPILLLCIVRSKKARECHDDMESDQQEDKKSDSLAISHFHRPAEFVDHMPPITNRQ